MTLIFLDGVVDLLEEAQGKSDRPINPTFYSPAEWTQKHQTNNNFLTQIVKQPKIFLIGIEDELTQLG